MIFLRFGETDDNKQVYVKIGKIECGDGSVSRGILADQNDVGRALKEELQKLQLA